MMSLSSSHRKRAPLPCTCSSPPGLARSSPTAAVRSPERTIVFAHRGSVSVVDATYLGFVFNALQIGLPPGSSHVPQEPAKISYAVFCLKKKKPSIHSLLQIEPYNQRTQ